MATIHEEIDTWLAADLHGELSESEQSALHAHLVDCAACRQAHQETKTMNRILEETFDQEKPDPAFEQRILSDFRSRVPQRSGFVKLLVELMRLRATQVAAVAAVLLGLVQAGKMITGEGLINQTAPAQSAQWGRLPGAGDIAQTKTEERRDEKNQASATGALEKSDKLAAAKPKDLPFAAPPEMSQSRSRIDQELKTSPATITPATAAQAEMAAQTTTSEPGTSKAVSESVPTETSPPALGNRKLIRNAVLELEITSFDSAVQKITLFANEEHGYVATTDSEKQANGKLKGQVVVKVLPENLDRFLQKTRSLGELKNQTLGTEDVTKAYFDTDARLKNAHVMEQRLIEMLKTKTGKVSDLLQVEKELGRVREEIEKMQGELKYWDSQVQFATVTISLAEKDLEEPAAFLLKERAQLSLYSPDVEKIYNEAKSLASPRVQITNAQLNRDYAGRVSAQLSMLVSPEESDAVISRLKAFGRVENFQMQTQRIAQGGSGISENARTKRDKVEINITVSREEQEQAFQRTSLRIRTSSVDNKTRELRTLVEKQGGRVLSSTFSRDPNGHEVANVSLRLTTKNYPALMQSLEALGKVENVSAQRQDRGDAQIEESNAPADISIQVYSEGNIVTEESGLLATLRRTAAQSARAITWSLRMIGVAIAFLAPWAIAIAGIVWITRRAIRARR